MDPLTSVLIGVSLHILDQIIADPGSSPAARQAATDAKAAKLRGNVDRMKELGGAGATEDGQPR